MKTALELCDQLFPGRGQLAYDTIAAVKAAPPSPEAEKPAEDVPEWVAVRVDGDTVPAAYFADMDVAIRWVDKEFPHLESSCKSEPLFSEAEIARRVEERCKGLPATAEKNLFYSRGVKVLDTIAALTRERDQFKKLFNEALDAVDEVFQTQSDKPPPLLPDFCPGMSKFRAVVELAKDYKAIKQQLAAAQAENEKLKAELAEEQTCRLRYEQELCHTNEWLTPARGFIGNITEVAANVRTLIVHLEAELAEARKPVEDVDWHGLYRRMVNTTPSLPWCEAIKSAIEPLLQCERAARAAESKRADEAERRERELRALCKTMWLDQRVSAPWPRATPLTDVEFDAVLAAYRAQAAAEGTVTG